MPLLVALVGALAIGLHLQYLFDRRITLKGTSVPFIFGFWLMGCTYFGRVKAMIYVGRLFTGLVNGTATPASQIYM